MPMMTERRVADLRHRAFSPGASGMDHVRLAGAIAQRQSERGPSKLVRRLRRKVELGRNGAF